MIAAEHGGLPSGKVGGVGDVIAELPPALVGAGLTVSVLVPSYGVYHNLSGSRLVGKAEVAFAGSEQRVELYELPALDTLGGASCWVIHHPVFGTPPGQIYHHDSAESPFATDANIYALFCAGALELLAQEALATPDVIHLHDWHAATFALLCRNDARVESKALTQIPIVYTVHNLALQGVRPLRGHPSSLEAWFPHLTLPVETVCDPRYTDCYNPMRAGIVLADRVHVVSPTYAQEVLLPNAPELSRHGGEGLEQDLARRAAQGELFGILNGCDYPDEKTSKGSADASVIDQLPQLREARAKLIDDMQRQLAVWFGQHEQLRSSDYLASKTLDAVAGRLAGEPKDCFLVTSVGRMTAQKVGLLLSRARAVTGQITPLPDTTLLDNLLLQLGDRGLLVMLGSGDAALEAKMVEHAARHTNFVFLRGFSETLAEHLYRSGDLFLMPSLFEPCGISQLLAMREGQPCLVHAVGGLCDTVTEDTGFVFDGDDEATKVQAASTSFAAALAERVDEERWAKRRTLAAANRFSWSAAAVSYQRDLYRLA